MTIVNDLLGTAVNPYLKAAKLGAIALAVAAVVAFIWSWHDRGRQIETLTSTQDAIVQAATVATVKPGRNGQRATLRPADVPAAIAALSNSLQSADATLSAISARTLAAKAASDAADKVLDRDLEKMRRDAAKLDLDSWDPWKP